MGQVKNYIVAMGVMECKALVADCSDLINKHPERRAVVLEDDLDRRYHLERRYAGHGEYFNAVVNGHGQTLMFVKGDDYEVKDWMVANAVADRNKDFQRKNPQYYVNTYEEANITHRFIYKGFEVRLSSKKFSPYHNWFGLSTNEAFSSEALFNRGSKTIFMSLQGLLCPYNEKYHELFEGRSVKYILFKDGDNTLYETWTGELPSNDFIEDFIA